MHMSIFSLSLSPSLYISLVISTISFKITSDFRHKMQLNYAKSASCIGELLFKEVEKHCKTLNVANFVCALKSIFC